MMGEDSSPNVSPVAAIDSRAVDDFPALPDSPPSTLNRRLRICIATSDLLGPIRNGGVGTASAVLAEVLASAGHHVTLLYAGPYEQGDAHQWQAHFQQRQIEFATPPKAAVALEGSQHVQASYQAYEWLKAQPRFDVIHFPDINGVGFYAMQAKRLGLAFLDTYLYVVLHSPTLWHRVENREPIDDEQNLALEFLERRSIEWADALVSPSRYLLQWTKDWGFRLPANVFVHPYASHREQV